MAELARRMVELSGLSVRDEANPDGDIEIVITGLRPGEKLYEEFFRRSSSAHHAPQDQRAQDPFIPWHDLEVDLETLKILVSHNNVEMILAVLQKLVGDYRSSDEVVDWVFSEQIRQNNGMTIQINCCLGRTHAKWTRVALACLFADYQ